MATLKEGQERLIANLDRRTAADLEWLLANTAYNKTGLANRAIHLLRLATEAQGNGGATVIDDPASGPPQRITLV